jgi:hypothetical protein
MIQRIFFAISAVVTLRVLCDSSNAHYVYLRLCALSIRRVEA